jgi:pilus assembly protein CpaF
MTARGMLLLIRSPDGSKRRVTCEGTNPVIVGRDPSCDICLPDDIVSRRHARIEPASRGGIQLTDLSANGTIVGDRLIQKQSILLRGSPIHIGPYRIQARELASGTARNVLLDDEVLRSNPPSGTAAALEVPAALRREIHRRLLDHLDLVKLERSRMNPHMMRAKVGLALQAIVEELAQEIPAGTDMAQLVSEMADEALGFGPLEPLLADDSISEIMVVDPDTIYVERNGTIELTKSRFTDDASVRAVLERIVTPLGRRIDESSPLLDARLPDGSRVNAVIRPLALRGACITIRKFSKQAHTLDDLRALGSLDDRIARFLSRAVAARKNILIAGGTASGKTTLLNAISAAVPERERIVTIEDAAELRLQQPHVVSLEARPPNMEGRGEVAIRDLVKNAVRMRPDRIIVGEVRGGEALDMLQAMNTGHEGSLTTLHANSAADAVHRLETLSLLAGVDLPSRAIREQIAAAIHLIVHQVRFSDGTRRISSVAEVTGLSPDGDIEVREILGFRRTGTGPDGGIIGAFHATGYLPSFLDEFISLGLIEEGEPYL